MKLSQVKKLCKKRNLALTPLRATVLDLIYNYDKPVGAYELLRELRSSRPNAEPPTIYRALEFLTEHNLAHRIDTTNSYVACKHPENEHQGQFLLCITCGIAKEIIDSRILRAINQCASENNFIVNHNPTEIRGVCDSCSIVE